MMNAKEMREVTNKSNVDKVVVNDSVNKIIERAHERAKDGKSTLKYRDDDFGSSKLYAGKPSEVQNAIMSKLRDLGYEVKIGSEERQFVDIYLEVNW